MCLLMRIVRLLSDLLPLNILNYSQSVDVLARLFMYVCDLMHINYIHAVCTAFLEVGQAFPFR